MITVAGISPRAHRPRRSCKFQDKGCIYYHPPVCMLQVVDIFLALTPASSSMSRHTRAFHTSSLSVPCSTPCSPPDSPTPSAALPAQAVNAPVFVPKGHPGSPTPSAAVPASIQQQASVSSYVLRNRFVLHTLRSRCHISSVRSHVYA